ncbi:MAG: hypothetical protein F6K65_38335 [Moorea sp. SIO3C2]|nr:hypothetical protein [Moorena sp. SIO3C2]
MTATDRLKKQRRRKQVPARDTSIVSSVPPDNAMPVEAVEKEAIAPSIAQEPEPTPQAEQSPAKTKVKSTIKKTSVHLEQERHKSLQMMCLSEEITMSTLLEAFDLASDEFPDARTAIIAKARELTQARKELGDKRRSKAFSKRL